MIFIVAGTGYHNLNTAGQPCHIFVRIQFKTKSDNSSNLVVFKLKSRPLVAHALFEPLDRAGGAGVASRYLPPASVAPGGGCVVARRAAPIILWKPYMLQLLLM